MITHGDCLTVLQSMADNSVDAVVCDPPYGLKFMGKKWDYEIPSVELWRECLRVLKPGGHMLAFGGPRTYHRLAVAIEDAGFEIRDQVQWIFGSGFPKSHNIEKATGDTRFKGFGTALKPANEPICLARKPLGESTVAKNVLKYGTGGINVDGCRVNFQSTKDEDESKNKNQHADFGNIGMRNNVYGKFGAIPNYNPPGRFPANLILDEEAGALLDEQSGECKSAGTYKKTKSTEELNLKGLFPLGYTTNSYAGQTGGASRFFLRVKYDSNELCGNENTKGVDTFAGKKTESKNENLSTDGYMNKPTDQFQMGTISITEMGTHSIMSFPILNVSTKMFTGTCTIESARTIDKFLVESVEGVSVVSDTEVLLHLPNEKLERITGIVNLALENTSLNGVIKTVNIGTPIIEAIENGASRFLYCAKASKSERGEGNGHPTVKPIRLMRYLCRLITPPGGTVLDPFMGSGSTGVAAIQEGFQFIGIEREAEYVEIAKKRIDFV